jgi:ABC-type branched-subunit amino acid transport system substrate-binding protein
MRKSRLSTRLAIVPFAALVVALAVSAGAGARTDTSKAADFKMMIISGFGGVASNANPEILSGAQAAADRINKAGGLHGRQIVLTGCSTQNSTTGDANCARQAVDGGYENVIWRSSFAAGSYKITGSAGIPSIGNVGTLTGDYTPKLAFPIVETSQNDFVVGMAQAAQDKSLKKWAGIGLQNSGSALTVNQTRTVALKYGRQYVGGILSQVLPVPDYLPIVQKLSQMNPDVVVASLSVPQHIAWHAAMVQLGWHPKVIVTNTGTNTVAVVDQFADKGSIPMIGGGGTPDASVPVPGNKLITAFRKDIAASGLDKDPVNYSASSVIGWIAVDALGKLATKIKGEVNKTTLVAAAQKVTKKHPIDFYGLFQWAPGSPGPAAVPRFRAGTGWAHRWDAASNRWVTLKSYDTWKILGYKLP